MIKFSFLLFGFVCTFIVVLIFTIIYCLAAVNSRNKDQEDQEQIQWIEEYKVKKLREKGNER